MNAERETANSAAATRHVPGADDDATLVSYRSWALQSNLAAVFDRGTTWLERPSELGLGEDAANGSARGQSELLRGLASDTEIPGRWRTMLLQWVMGFVVVVASQYTAFGLPLAEDEFSIALTVIVVSLAIPAVLLPRLREPMFDVAEQAMAVPGFATVAFLCAASGGVDSPYMVWWLYAAIYVALFVRPPRATANMVAITALALAPVVYDSSAVDTDSLVMLALLIAVIWVMGVAVLRDREFERSAERGVRYLLLADSLTGVANLRALERIVEEATRGGQSRFGLVFVDLSGLKGANAAFGHEIGDDMLMRLAGLMRHACVGPAQVARIRGEQFAVYLPGADIEQTKRWIERFERAAAIHNEWIRNRVPRISVTKASVTYPEDGTRASQLFEAADRRMLAEKAKLVRPPHEVQVSTGVMHLLRESGMEAASRLRVRPSAGASLWAGWAAAAAFYLAYVLADGVALRYPRALVAISAFCAIVAVARFALDGTHREPAVAVVADAASMALIVPVMWVTGGWESPLQLGVFLTVLFFSQFRGGRTSVLCAAFAIACWSAAFWLGGYVGVARSPVSPSGETLFVIALGAQLMIAAVTQLSRRASGDALRLIHDTATRDPLTGLKNIYAFRDDLHAMVDVAERDAGRGSPAGDAAIDSLPALAIVDIDDFRGIGNRLGFQATDSIMIAVAERLRKTVGELAEIYQVDGDEFAALFEVEDGKQAVEFASGIGEAVTSEPGAAPRLVEPIGLGYGTAVWRPGVGVTTMIEEAAGELAVMRSNRGGDGPRGGAVLL